MNPHYISVSARARHVCEYCRAPEGVFNLAFEVEHIIPQSQGGEATEDNLALSCRSCNLYKSSSVSAFDKITQTEIRLFNPRADVWNEHFLISEESAEIKDLTAIGRVTVARLRINSNAQTDARKQWLKLGLLY